MDDEETWVVRRGPSRRAGHVLLVAALVAIAVGAAVAWPETEAVDPAGREPPASHVTSSTGPPTTTVSSPAAVELDILTDAVRLSPPSARPALVATFRGFVVWGSAGGVEVNVQAAQTRPLPPPPVQPRDEAAAVWTGNELLVWGGRHAGRPLADGAAYDLVRDSWRAIAAGPLPAGAPMASVWTGGEMLVWVTGGDGTLMGAAYEPESDSWRRLREAPIALGRGNGVLLDDPPGASLAVVGSPLDGRREPVALLYGLAEDRWTTLPSPDLLPQSTWLSAVGDELITWDYSLEGRRFTPGADAWSALPDIPLEGRECYIGGSTGPPPLVTYCDQAAAFDLEAGEWRRATIPGVGPAAGDVTFGPVTSGSGGQVVLTTEGMFVLRRR